MQTQCVAPSGCAPVCAHLCSSETVTVSVYFAIEHQLLTVLKSTTYLVVCNRNLFVHHNVFVVVVVVVVIVLGLVC